MIAIPIRWSRLTVRAIPTPQSRPHRRTVMRMPLPMQPMPNHTSMKSRRKALPRCLRGCLENVSGIATNQSCRLGSVGNDGCQKPFVGDLTDFSAQGFLVVREYCLMILTASSGLRDRDVPRWSPLPSRPRQLPKAASARNRPWIAPSVGRHRRADRTAPGSGRPALDRLTNLGRHGQVARAFGGSFFTSRPAPCGSPRLRASL